MKSQPHSISTGPQRLFAMFTLVAAFGLSGCASFFVHVRSVPKTIVIDKVQTATLDQLLAQLDAQAKTIQTINASVDITATSGGEHKGEVKEIPTFAGYILIRKPADLHLLMLVPVLRSRALDMVSDGKDFKLIIPSQNKAITGSELMTTGTQTGLYSLRPGIIRDALIVPPIGPDDLLTLTESSRITPPSKGHKESVEEPDYDLTIMRLKPGRDHELELVRRIHFGRVTLQPYEQDIYDHQGRVVTTILYDNWHKYGDVVFPTSLFITRPLDEYTLKIVINKLTPNQPLDDEEFVLKIPDNYTVQKM